MKCRIFKTVKSNGLAISSEDIVLSHTLDIPFVPVASNGCPFILVSSGHTFHIIIVEWDNDKQELSLFEEDRCLDPKLPGRRNPSVSEIAEELMKDTPWELYK